jgi:hypothetical protein
MQLSQLGKRLQNGSRFGQLSMMITNKLYFGNKDTGLKAIIGIHNSVMG